MSVKDALVKLLKDLGIMEHLWRGVDGHMDPQAESTITLIKNISSASDMVAEDIESLQNQNFGSPLDQYEAQAIILRFPDFKDCVFSTSFTPGDIAHAKSLANDLLQSLEDKKTKNKKVA